MCAFSSILLLTNNSCEYNTFLYVLCTALDRSPHILLDFYMILICEIHPPLLFFCAKID